LASRLLEGYLAEPYEVHTTRNSSVLIRNMTESITSFVNWSLLPMLAIASEALMVLGMVVVLAVVAPVVTLVATVFLGLQTFVVIRLLRPRLSALGVSSQEMAATSLEQLQRSLHGFREVRLSGRSDEFVTIFDDRRRGLSRVLYLHSTLSTLPRLVVETVFVLGLVVFLAVATGGDPASPETLSLLGLFAYAVLRVMPSLNRVLLNVGYLRFGNAAVDDITEALAELRPVGGAMSSTGVLKATARLEAAGVTYRYPNADRDSLRGVDLYVEPGEFVGLVGATGSGKSTLVDVLVGLLRPTSGAVLVDGVDVAHRVGEWQRSLGVVSQNVFLVDDTLRRNIAFGLPDHEIDEEAVVAAVRMAQLELFVAELPHGLDTLVGERGVRLSGGQRQRVAIARALYAAPSVLFFDEGTSALDSRTEADVMASVEALRGDRMIVAVAHRLSTVRRCDRIYVLDDGEVVAVGRYEELAERSEVFRRMSNT
jgi:ATP-binding cassette subfamily C protein